MKAKIASDSVLAATIFEALRLRDRMKSDGGTCSELDENLEKILRLSWPKGRETEWKYLCKDCRDYGLVMADCQGDRTCGRDKPHLAHDFGRPCWCSRGNQFKAKPKAADDFTEEAGRTRRRPMSRLGR